MTKPPRATLAGLAIVGGLLLVGCGDTTGPADASAAAKPAGAGAGQTGDCSASPGTTITVDIGEFVFEPDTLQVGACDSVVWTNTHTQPHTSTGNGKMQWSSGNIQPGESSEPVLFDTTGTFTYICALHPFMKGTVEVS